MLDSGSRHQPWQSLIIWPKDVLEEVLLSESSKYPWRNNTMWKLVVSSENGLHQQQEKVEYLQVLQRQYFRKLGAMLSTWFKIINFSNPFLCLRIHLFYRAMWSHCNIVFRTMCHFLISYLECVSHFAGPAWASFVNDIVTTAIPAVCRMLGAVKASRQFAASSKWNLLIND